MTDAGAELPNDLTGNLVQVCTPESLKRRLLARRTAVGVLKAARPDQGNCFSTVGDDFGMSEETSEGVISTKYWQAPDGDERTRKSQARTRSDGWFFIAVLHIFTSQSPLEDHAETRLC
jgi:hypothetical protein